MKCTRWRNYWKVKNRFLILNLKAKKHMKNNLPKKSSQYFVAKIVFIVFFTFFFSPSQIVAQTDSKTKSVKQNTTYTINGKLVGKVEFDKLYHSLIEVKGTWHCGETDHGGVTGFKGKTKGGALYEYEMLSHKGHNSASIQKVVK